MTKIPVGQTVASAYGFLFGQIGTVLGIAGIPAILYAGADYASHAYSAAHRAELNAQEVPALGAAMMVTFAAMLAMMFAMSMAAVGVIRAALGAPDEGAGAASPFGRTTWRVFAANLRFLLGTIVLIGLASTVAYAAYWLAGIPLDAPEQIQPTIGAALAAMVSWAAFIYAFVSMLRMGFLLPATVVSESKGGLRRSHDLGQNNVWRLIGIAAALVLPILFLLVAAASAVLSSALGPDFAGQALTPEVMQRIQQAIEQRLLPWEIFNAVIFVLYSGLIYSGSAFAYRSAAGKGD